MNPSNYTAISGPFPNVEIVPTGGTLRDPLRSALITSLSSPFSLSGLSYQTPNRDFSRVFPLTNMAYTAQFLARRNVTNPAANPCVGALNPVSLSPDLLSFSAFGGFTSNSLAANSLALNSFGPFNSLAANSLAANLSADPLTCNSSSSCAPDFLTGN